MGRRLVSFVAGLAVAAVALAQEFNNPSNLAPYVPSPQIVVEKMLEAAQVKPGELVYDLGFGDGRVLITAAQKYKARAVGVELSEKLFNDTTAKVKALGLEDRVTLVHGNLLEVDLSQADVVVIYLLTTSNDQVKPRLEKYLKPGARVISHDFVVRGWKPSRIETLKADRRAHTVYVYEVPPARP